MIGQAVIHSSVRCDWGTPKAMFEALDREFGFVLDVAASEWSAKCDRWLGPEQPIESMRDGLTADWLAIARTAAPYPVRHPAVFMNPPYSKKLWSESVKAGTPDLAMRVDSWTHKAVAEAARGLIVVGVLPASVQTEWWQEDVWSGQDRASEVRFIPHRVSFDAPPDYHKEEASSAGGNTAVVIWRPDPGYVGAWAPTVRYWTYRQEAA